MEIILNILLTIQPLMMAYTIFQILSKWKRIGTLKWLLLIPSFGLCQVIFSTIIGPIIIGKQEGTLSRELMATRIQTYNLMLISLYGITEYYAAAKYICKNISSIIARSIVNWILHLTSLIALAFLFSLPANNISSQKIITAILSFQLIFFSIYLLIDLLFRDEIFTFDNNPIFIVSAAIFILFSSTFPVYYLSGYFATNITEASKILNLTILFSYLFFYSTIIYTIKWIIA